MASSKKKTSKKVSKKKAPVKKAAAKKAVSKKRTEKKTTPKKAAVKKPAPVEKKIVGKTILGKLQHLKLNPANIIIDGDFNPRIDKGDLTELMASIKKDGVQQPIKVRRDGKFMHLVDGERRLLSTLKLGLKTIPAIETKGKKSENELLVLALIHNDGKPLAPVEEADAFRRLLKSGMTVKQIAASTGKRLGLVKNRIALISAHPDVASAVKSGKLTLSMGTQIAKKAKGKEAKQKRMVKQATKGKKGKDKVALEMGKASLTTKLERKVITLQNRLNKLVVIINKKRAKKDRVPAQLASQVTRFSKHPDKEVRAAFVAGGIYAVTDTLAGAKAKRGKEKAKVNVRVKTGKGKRKA